MYTQYFAITMHNDGRNEYRLLYVIEKNALFFTRIVVFRVFKWTGLRPIYTEVLLKGTSFCSSNRDKNALYGLYHWPNA